jgi:hypothetical protein
MIDFVLALTTSVGSLYFIAPGIVGYYATTLNFLERTFLIILSLVMIVDPLDAASVKTFVTGLIPLILGIAFLVHNRMVSRKTPAMTA